MPSLRGLLPFIDYATQMQMDVVIEIEAEIGVEPTMKTKPKTFDMESWKSRFTTNKEAIQRLKQVLGSFDRDVIENCIQTLEDLSQKVYGSSALISTNEESAISISRK